MLLENRPNIVVDDNYKMFVKEMQRRYAERGAVVYTDKDAIEQERRDAHARNMAPDAYRMSSGIKASVKSEGFMTTEEYLNYFGKCHDTFDAVNYYTLHKEQEATAEDKVLVNRKMVQRIRQGERRPVRQAPVRECGLFDGIAEFIAGMSRGSRRMATGLAAAALSLSLMIGGVALFAGDKPDVEYARNAQEAQLMNAEEAENVIQR